MGSNPNRTRVRLMLGKWGGWTVLMERLLRERAFAREWLERDGDEPPRRLLREIEREIDDMTRLRAALGELVREMSVEQQQVLVLRYENRLSWLQIALKLNYDERSVRRLEERAVDAIARRVGGEG